MERRDGQPGPLTDVCALARALAGPAPPVLLDVRWRLGGPPGIDSYRAGHLPRSVFVDLDTDLAAEPGPAGRHPLPSASGFQAAMRRAGVSEGSTVVVYDEADATAAARAWWLLRYFGHRDCQVLDGGIRAWVAAGARDDSATSRVNIPDIKAHAPVPAPPTPAPRPAAAPTTTGRPTAPQRRAPMVSGVSGLDKGLALAAALIAVLVLVRVLMLAS